jgi:ferrous iron transport protein A
MAEFFPEILIIMNTGTLRLTTLKSGDQGVVVSLGGGRAFHSRMVSMGLRPGGEIKVIRNAGGGPILVAARETRLALGRGMAEKILVRPLLARK